MKLCSTFQKGSRKKPQSLSKCWNNPRDLKIKRQRDRERKNFVTLAQTKLTGVFLELTLQVFTCH